MPRGDRTGPAGMGPMTGRGAGYCAGFATPGYANGVPGRGFGMGMGRGGGMGRGNRFFNQAPQPYPQYAAAPQPAPLSKEEEVAILRQQADNLSSQAEAIKARLEELEK